jgi:polyhydroxybutyrate depolymerase
MKVPMRFTLALALLLALSATPAAAQPLAAGTQEVRLASGGVARTYVVHRPRQAGALPLVVMLHGAGGRARQTVENYRWDRLADREGFVVVAPQGLPVRPAASASLLLNPNVWNDGSERFTPERRAVDDVAFIAAVIDDVAARAAIDRARIYVAGMSNGAAMAFRMGARMPERFAAVGAVASHFWDPPARIAPPLSLLFIAGDRDPLNPLAGGEGRNPWGGPPVAKPPMRRSAEAWAAAVGCRAVTEPNNPDLPPQLIHLPPQGERWTGCPPGIAVVMMTMHGMGHVWPGALRELPERLVGPRIAGFDATGALWAFFQSHRRG